MLAAFAPNVLVSRLLGRASRAAAAAPRVTRLEAFGVRGGTLRPVPRGHGRMTLHCRSGTAWIVHDGEGRDVVLQASQSYVVDSHQPMTAYAVEGDCALEIQLDR